MREPGVHTGGVGVEQRLPFGVGARVGLLRHVPEAMNPRLRVHLERAGANERGQLACGLTPLQIHLEESILRVDEAERPRHVDA